MSEERYCSNCRAEIPKGVVVCPVCGVYAGDVFDGKLPRRRRSYGTYVIVILGVIAIFAVTSLFVRWPHVPIFESKAPSPQTAPSLAKDLHGAAGAMLAVRRRLVSDQIPNECLVLMSSGPRNGEYIVHAADRCRHKQLGDWKVDAKTYEVSR